MARGTHRTLKPELNQLKLGAPCSPRENRLEETSLPGSGTEERDCSAGARAPERLQKQLQLKAELLEAEALVQELEVLAVGQEPVAEALAREQALEPAVLEQEQEPERAVAEEHLGEALVEQQAAHPEEGQLAGHRPAEEHPREHQEAEQHQQGHPERQAELEARGLQEELVVPVEEGAQAVLEQAEAQQVEE